MQCKNKFIDNPYKSKYCSYKCVSESQRKFDPTPDELKELVWKMSTTKVAEMFGVSDTAIDKRCKKFNIDKPPRGYWAKQYSINGHKQY